MWQGYKDKGVQVIGVDVWNGSNNSVQNYAQGGGRNVTYPLGLNGGSVGSTWGVDRSSYAIVDATGKVAFITLNSVPYFQRYTTYRQAIIDKLDELTATTGVDAPTEVTPEDFSLEQNSPNPFSATTSIRVSLGTQSASAHTRLVIYDLLGREIRNFTDIRPVNGNYSARWDGRTNRGEIAPPGIYFYALESGSQRVVKRLIFLGK